MEARGAIFALPWQHMLALLPQCQRGFFQMLLATTQPSTTLFDILYR
jgi:hypothetical protein